MFFAFISPLTCNFLSGDFVPIPTLPSVVIVITFFVAFNVSFGFQLNSNRSSLFNPIPQDSVVDLVKLANSIYASLFPSTLIVDLPVSESDTSSFFIVAGPSIVRLVRVPNLVKDDSVIVDPSLYLDRTTSTPIL